MSEKRFFTKVNRKGRNVIIDKECHIEIIDLTLACEVLNRLDLKLKTYNEQLGEQQATINKQLDQIIELQDKYRILEFNHSRLEKRNKAQYEKIGEQQATINKLRKILAEAEDTIEVRLAEHYLKEYENIKHNIIGDNDE